MARGGTWDVWAEFEGRTAFAVLGGLGVGLTSLEHPSHLLAILVLWWMRSLRWRALAIVSFALGLVLSPTPPPSIVDRTYVSGVGAIVSAPRVTRQGQACQLEIQGERLLLITSGLPWLALGDTVFISAVAKPLNDPDGSFRMAGIGGEIFATGTDVRRLQSGGLIANLGSRCRQSFRSYLSDYLLPDSASVIEASVFGSDDVPADLRTEMRLAGMLALASAAGMQVMLLGAFVLAVASRLPLSRGWVLAILGTILCLYSVTSGLHPGAIRASVMFLIMGSAYVARREPDMLSALAVAAFLELIWKPVWIFDLGFQLSFLVVTVLALYVPAYRRQNRSWMHSIRFMGIVAIVASLVSMPLLAYETGRISFATPLSTVLVGPIIPALIFFGVAGWLANPVLPIAGSFLALRGAGPFAGWILHVSDRIAVLPWLTWEVPPFSAYWLLPIYVLAVAGARVSGRAFTGAGRGS